MTDVTDYDCARLCEAIYAYPGDAPVTWDYFDEGEDDGVCWAVKRAGDTDVIVFRGSTTPQDWLRDFEAIAAPVDAGIGPVHVGFARGLFGIAGQVAARTPKAVIVTGHSLGAGRASIFAGCLKLVGIKPASRVVFGEPRPGFKQLGEFLSDVPGRSYRNADGQHHDLITDVPFSGWAFPYVHPTPLIDVNAPPPDNDPWGIFSFHHVGLYVQALSKRTVQ